MSIDCNYKCDSKSDIIISIIIGLFLAIFIGKQLMNNHVLIKDSRKVLIEKN